jgi:hypothetical protein
MAALTEDVKLYVVQALACFDSPSQVAQAVKEQFGLQIDRRQVEAYDPTKSAGKSVAKKLKAIFEETREAFLKETSAVPVAKQVYRMRVLQRALDRAEKVGNQAMVLQILEQAAKESGGAFTNRRELTGKGGGPIQQSQVTAQELREAVQSVREDY